MVTTEAFQDPHLEEVGWENFLGMTIGQAVVWASQNIDPKYMNPELTTSEPYVMGSHATCSGAWVSGPEDLSPPEYFWGYNRMTTVDGLFGAGDTVGGSAHKFSSGSFTEGRLAAKAAVKYIQDLGDEKIDVSNKQCDRSLRRLYINLWKTTLWVATKSPREQFHQVIFCLFKVFNDFRRLWTNMLAVSVQTI